MRSFPKAACLLVALYLSPPAAATGLWQDIQGRAADSGALNARAISARRLAADIDTLQARLAGAQTVTLPVPLPDGRTAVFELVPAPVMAAALALKYPSIITLRGHEVGNRRHYGRFDITPHGFHAMFRYDGETVFIDPEQRGNDRHYISYFKKHARPMSVAKPDIVHKNPSPQAARRAVTAQARPGDTVNLRTYRLAVSTTGEYTAFHGGTVAGGLAAIATLVNRLNQLFERDLAVRLELVADNDRIVFTNAATDPFDNNNNSNDLDTNSTVLADNIGNRNFDVGHVLTTAGGGIAFLGVICDNANKAGGVSGSPFPTGDSFYIDLVAHELGHQFGAAHTFNGTSDNCGGGNRSAFSAYEPGSGSTIMAYAGICGQENLQFSSDDYFHAHSLAQMRAHISSGSGANCGTETPLNGNEEPLAAAPADATIPANTPFVLEGSGADSSNAGLGAQLSYVWEQLDLGSASNSAASMASDDGSRPLFRSRPPAASPNRYFPRLSDVLQQTTSRGETYPTSNRTLRFRLTVRNSIGGTAFDDVRITTVNSAGPFSVSQPAQGTVWEAFEAASVQWDVAGTDRAPVNCANVDIYLSTDNGGDFSRLLVSATPNDGSHSLPAPSAATDRARVMVRCSDNIFFAVNSGSFTINNTNQPFAPVITGQAPITINEDSSRSIQLSDLTVTDLDNNYPDGFTLTLQAGGNYQIAGSTVTPAANFFGELSVPVSVNDGVADSNVFTLRITVDPVNDPPVTAADRVSVNGNSSTNMIDVLANDSDIDSSNLTLTNFSYSGGGTVSIIDNQLAYTPPADFSGSEDIEYTVVDSSGASASGVATVTVSAASSGGGGGGGAFGVLELLALLWLGRRLRSGAATTTTRR